MINAARTFLLNRHTSGPGSEYIDPQYKPRKLPPYLQEIHYVLFGKELDDKALNQRVRQLMTILHTGDLRHHIYPLDGRVTYWPMYDLDCFFEENPALISFVKLLDKLAAVVSRNANLLFDSSADHVFRVFKQNWDDGHVMMNRLSGVLLAFIYKVSTINEVEEC